MTRFENGYFLTFCGLLLTISAFSVDIVLPAFDLMSADLGVDVTQVQMSVPVYFLGFGIGQILFGPLSDAFGRKRSIYVALGIYLGGSVLALAWPGLTGLLAGRVLQGIGGGAVQVVARAMIRDLFSGTELARNMSFAMTIFAFGPIVAPLAGALVILQGAWEPIFFAMIAFGVGLIFMGTRAPETLTKPDPSAIRPVNLINATRDVLINKQSRYFVIVSGFATVCILSLVTNVPVIMANEFGTDRNTFAVMFAISAIGIIIGQKFNRLMLTRIGPARAALAGALGCATAFGLILLLALTNTLALWSLVALLFGFNMFYLTIFANAVALSIDPHGRIAGLAASVTGFLASLIGAVVSGAYTVIADGRVTVWATLILVQSLVVAALLYYWRKRYRE